MHRGGPAEGGDGGGAGTRAYDAVLFDVFGTLIDFRSTFDLTLRRILSDMGIEGRASVFFRNWRTFTFQGESQGEFVTVHEDFESGLVSTLDSLGIGGVEGYCKEVIDDLFEHLRVASVYPEVKGVVGELDSRGVEWAVVSNIDEGDLRALLEHHGLRPRAAVSSEAARSYKPDAGPFLMGLRGLGVPPGRALHVGDSPLMDVDGARRLGIATAWVNRYNDAYPPDLPAPRFTINDLVPVPGMVSGD